MKLRLIALLTSLSLGALSYYLYYLLKLRIEYKSLNKISENVLCFIIALIASASILLMLGLIAAYYISQNTSLNITFK